MSNLKRVIIKEELVALLGDYKKAILLNQFIYWSERVRDFDKFIAEEKERAANHGITINMELQNGWIYKSLEELSEETMLGLRASNISSHINELVARGYLAKRRNPEYRWDRTYQYRVNLIKIQQDLNKLGYCLEGYPLQICQDGCDDTFSVSENAFSETENAFLKTERQKAQNNKAIPEITTEITLENATTGYILNQSVSQSYHYSNGRTDGKGFDYEFYDYLKKSVDYDSFAIEDQKIIEVALSGLLAGDFDAKKPRAVVMSILEKLDYWAVERALQSYRNNAPEMIKRPISYFQQCLLNAGMEDVLESNRFKRNKHNST